MVLYSMPNIIEIQRSKRLSTVQATYGHMLFNGIAIGATVEQPWFNNKNDRSCIPAGVYQLHPHNSPKHPNTVSFHNPSLNVYAEQNLIPHGTVGARFDCLIHSANFSSELEGCIAPGVDYFYDGSLRPIGVKESRVAYDRLVGLWGDRQGLTAVISWVD